MFNCPECGGKTEVYDVRHFDTYSWRRRKCLSCGYRFTTKEKYIENASRFSGRNKDEKWKEEWELKC